MKGIVEQTPYITIAKGGERHMYVYGSNIIEDTDKIIDLYMIEMDTTECNYGNERNWLICPTCGKRRLSLYYDDYEFKCRKCAGLLYDIQTVSKKYRDDFNSLFNPLKLKHQMLNNRRPYYKGSLTKRAKRQVQKLLRYCDYSDGIHRQ